MSLLALLNSAQGGDGVAALGRAFGLDATKSGELAALLAPAIGSAAKKRAEAGQADLIARQLLGEREAAFFDDAAQAAQPEGRAQGARFLDETLGSQEARNRLADEAARRTGVDSGTVADFLPAIAAMLQGGMQRQMPDKSLQGLVGGGRSGGLIGLAMGLLGGRGRGRGQGSELGMLTALLDRDGDGSVLDDVVESFLRR